MRALKIVKRIVEIERELVEFKELEKYRDSLTEELAKVPELRTELVKLTHQFQKATGEKPAAPDPDPGTALERGVIRFMKGYGEEWVPTRGINGSFPKAARKLIQETLEIMAKDKKIQHGRGLGHTRSWRLVGRG